jgi:hypothetical protein
MHVLRVGIRRRKQAINLNARVYFPGKAGEFVAVHFFAGIFIQAPSGACHLGRAGGH